MDNVWVLIILFLGGAWLIGWMLVRMEKRSRLIDFLRLDTVNSLHYHHRVFQTRFNKIDDKFNLVFKDVKDGGDPPRELPDIITSILWVQEELLHLRLDITLRLIVDNKSWLLQDGYAKQVADYYHPRWDTMISAVTNKLKVINDQLEELGFDNSNSKATQQH